MTPPEAYIAVGLGFVSLSGVVITAIIKAPWKRNGSVPIDVVSDNDCDDRRNSLGKIYDEKIKVVDTKLDGVVREQKTQSQTLKTIGDTTIETLQEIRFRNGN